MRGHGFVDDGGGWSPACGTKSRPRSKGMPIVWKYPLPTVLIVGIDALCRMILCGVHVELVVGGADAERHHTHKADGANPGQRRNPFPQLERNCTVLSCE